MSLLLITRLLAKIHPLSCSILDIHIIVPMDNISVRWFGIVSVISTSSHRYAVPALLQMATLRRPL